jgi:hypothetical protein
VAAPVLAKINAAKIAAVVRFTPFFIITFLSQFFLPYSSPFQNVLGKKIRVFFPMAAIAVNIHILMKFIHNFSGLEE